MFIPNNITKTALEAFLAKRNGISNSSYSQKILTIRVIDLLPCFPNKQLIDLLLDVAKISNKNAKTKEVAAILNEVNSKTPVKRLKLIASSTLKIFLGASGKFLAYEFFQVLKKVNK